VFPAQRRLCWNSAQLRRTSEASIRSSLQEAQQMRTLGFGSSAVIAGLAAVFFTGCGSAQSPIGTPQASALAAPGSSTNYRVVYRFGAPPDGNAPLAPLIDVDDTLYGATNSGGSYDCSDGTGYSFGCGTVFSVTTGGTEKVLLAFTVGDGASPHSGLIDGKWTLYGTTYVGGCCGVGTVYSISTDGSEKVLYSFHNRAKGAEHPAVGLIDVNGILYGTTSMDGKGKNESGTFFSVTTAGVLSKLYHFKGGSDGAGPSGALLDVGGTLYGTTAYGGSNCAPQYTSSCGTVYSVTTEGVENVVYRFKGGSDGVHPHDRLIDVNGALYGATDGGGGHQSCETGSNQTPGCGTIYSVTTSGKEKVLYSFTGGADGGHPNGNLIDVKGTLYGTTSAGGAYNDGTLFSITLDGAKTVLHSFGGSGDGIDPDGGLIDVKGTLYGTTRSGGSDSCGTTSYPSGCGTVFAFTLPH
jgi:uncharacterized repeat protein (TIGR03803 family)